MSADRSRMSDTDEVRSLPIVTCGVTACGRELVWVACGQRCPSEALGWVHVLTSVDHTPIPLFEER